MKGYCPHFDEIMDLEDCFFCYFNKVLKAKEKTSKGDEIVGNR
jgi:hypothetical protein